MKRLFITGASGFIGAHIVRKALAAGCPVAVLLQPGAPTGRLQDIIGRLTSLTGDLAAPETWAPSLAAWRPETCIHLAWYAEPGRYLHAPENIDCLTNSLTLFRILASAGCRHIVAAGTCSEYDAEAGYFDEETPTRPATLYAACKMALGVIGQHLAVVAGGTLAWGRIFHLYGPGEDPRRVVPAAIASLLAGKPFAASEGTQLRDYLHVEDVAEAFLTLAEQGASGAFNICSGEPVTVRRLLETIGDRMGRRDLIQFGALPSRGWDPPRLSGDSRKLRALGWAPRRPLADGLGQTIAWWRNREERRETHP